MLIHEVDMLFFNKIDMDCPASGSHAISKGTLSYSDKTWFCKAASNALRARYEVMAQEFYRLIIPGQPETRIAKRPQDDQYFILSEEVHGIERLPLNKQARFTNGVYTGLGQILIASVFLHEIDLNLENVVVNNQNKVIKIDGDWSMAALVRPDLLHKQPAELTPLLLKNLLYLPESDYVAFNWFDICQRTVNLKKSAIFDETLLSAPHYIAEINQAMLKILLLPRHYIQQFIELYMPENTAMLLDIFISRQAELKESAMQMASFLTFLASPEASVVAQHQLDHIKLFAANDWYPVIQPAEHGMLHRAFDALVTELIPSNHGSPRNVTMIDNLERAEEPSAMQAVASVKNNNRLFSSSAGAGASTLRLNRTCYDLSALF